ncbi:hypothetical protein PTSG_07180 [Salpingoeca rosetta]|uniref:Tail-anchored protein insertion receptor WRB n=1 Tax=Salpingoeca rosetta (strain ATCC 50818 / BSB-021) TaxID=946362 RepID=F2UEA5_SALR5|nr:uncharacterized protein PTSG_07180 [Salpingoeca rosetta]EGD74955.1 hypothetical protein PTSG_07180 [Salpingoeca rosetta]|eukprot:XP_004992600.1 hypothetical protein PTSG_07180 [Salpingoeca rosetta]
MMMSEWWAGVVSGAPEAASFIALVAVWALHRVVLWVLSLDVMMSAKRKRVKKLRKDIEDWQTQLISISAMDELARYCKIERKISQAEKEISTIEPEPSVMNLPKILRNKAAERAVTIGSRALLFAVITYAFSGERFHIPDVLPNPLSIAFGSGPYSSVLWFPLCFGALDALTK